MYNLKERKKGRKGKKKQEKKKQRIYLIVRNIC